MNKTTRQIGKWTLECNEFGRVNAGNGTVEMTVVTSGGNPYCVYPCVTWEILDAARELRREWEEEPRLPDGWRDTGVCEDITYGSPEGRRAIVVGRDHPDTVTVFDCATPEQCAQIPAVQAWARHALARRTRGGSK